jgi:hypothetical protein
MSSQFIDNEMATTNYELLAFGSRVKSAKSPALNLWYAREATITALSVQYCFGAMSIFLPADMSHTIFFIQPLF